MKKIFVTFIVALLTLKAVTFSSSADWITNSTENVKCYSLKSENCAKSNVYRIDGIMYYFNNDRICEGRYTGWTKLKSNPQKKKYYIDGIAVTGCHKIGSYYYFFDKDGYMTDKSDKISMQISEIEIKYDENDIYIYYVIHNISKEELIYGNNYLLEKKEGESWQTVPVLDTWYYYDDANGLLPEYEDSRKIDVSFQYGVLESGTYRIAYDDCSKLVVSRSNAFEISVDKNG